MVKFLHTPIVAVLMFVVGTTTLTWSITGDTVNVLGGSGGGGSSRTQTTSKSQSANSSGGMQYCGNEIIDGLEQCDDGNGDNDDGCTISCMFPNCGDGYLQQKQGEECDDGTLNGEEARCSSMCKKNLCGNGKIDGSEECDDGNKINSDKCTNKCALPRCGDGVVQKGEQCDDGNGENTDLCTTSCMVSKCGDGFVQGMEQCDDGNTDSSDECTMSCHFPQCGDGVTQSMKGEECDEGTANGNAGHCLRTCKKPSAGSSSAAMCGNGTVEGDEQCDDGNTDSTDQCTSSCRFARCGDGILQHNEECDLGSGNGFSSCNLDCRKAHSGDGGTTIDNHDNHDNQDNGGGQWSQPTITPIDTIAPLPPVPSSVSSIDMGGNSSPMDDAMLRQQLKQAEERAKQAEQMMKMEEEMQRERQFLGCFDGTGHWTTSRDACDQNQKKHLETQTTIQTGEKQQEVAPVPVQHVSDTEVKQQIQEKFLGPDIAETKRSEILEVMNKAKDRLDTLLQGTNAPEVADYLKRSMDWLDQGISYFGSGVHSVDEIQAMAEPVRSLMQQVSTVLATANKLPKEKPAINPIVEKTDALLTKFRSAFVALVQSGIGLDQTSLQAYVDAAQQFMNVKDACLKDNTTCDRLKDVLGKLAEARPWLEDQLSAHPDIAKKLGM